MNTPSHSLPPAGLSPAEWFDRCHHVDELRQLISFLEAQGTFVFPQLPSGLFSAAASVAEEFGATGYQNVWVRDNVHVANAHLILGDRPAAAAVANAIMTFYVKHQSRLVDLLEGRLDPSVPMHRPHIRFDGTSCTELTEDWAHAQNDALGAFLWLYARLAVTHDVSLNDAARVVLADLVHFLALIEYWQDEDAGHWEEVRKIAASSIGVALAGLLAVRQFVTRPDELPRFAALERPIDIAQLDHLIDKGRGALDAILPHECRQSNPAQKRDADAALLFLIFPYNVVSPEQESQILDRVKSQLLGERGIRRYNGDSYWCADYKTLLPADERTADFSDDMGRRDALLKPGDEAQWCLFDPIISIAAGTRYLASGDVADLEEQRAFLRRSLSQLTDGSPPFPPYRCPESYYLERGKRVPNDLTPLLWSQANLRLALHAMEQSLSRNT
ncbi:MAG: glycoside hydrolase family 15 protein [Planctomycetaceae bacterium]